MDNATNKEDVRIEATEMKTDKMDVDQDIQSMPSIWNF